MTSNAFVTASFIPIRSPNVSGRATQMQIQYERSTPQEFEAYVKNENVKWSEVIKSQGLTPN
jgi:tripartite-type tricarboxylate transporter receptor subunit TctC